MPDRLNLPRLATLALCTVIGLQVAWIVAGQLGSRDAAPTPMATRGADTGGERTLQRIAAAQLFGAIGASGADASGAAPPTSLGLVLVGVFAREEPEGGRAIIGESAASGRLLAVGSTLPGGARLLEVYADRVILDVGGRRETLLMPRNTMPAAPPPAAPQVVATEGAAPLPTPAGAPGSMPNPAQLVRWQGILKDGQVAGVRVYPGERPELFKRSGLQPGDLVVELNGMPLASPASAAQFAQTLAATPTSTLRVERGGRTETVQVDMARLMASGAE